MFNDATAADLVQQMIVVTIKLALPVLAAGVFFGLVVSLLQSITSMQDQTLSTVPKILAMLVIAALIMPWILQRLVEYARDLFTLVGS
jgi:flagellar biosynthetic protein FliQ